ncbi:MAG: glutathione S-transferase family protein [Gammaproteobacteria bacterium]|nr:glutathione S-transferase family protein [Gammaproteobacteria bacterium]
MALTLHHCHQARSMRSLWLLYEMNLEVDLVIHSFGQELHAPDYLQHHPLGRVPCLIDDEITIFESGAICEYLCENYGDQGLWRPPGHAERPMWLQWLHYAETLVVHSANLTQQAIAIKDPELRSATVRKLETRRLEKALAVLDIYLRDRLYLLDDFSAIDTSIGYSLYVAQWFTNLQVLPSVYAYFQRLSERPAFLRSLPSADEPQRIYTQPHYWLMP